MLRTDLTSASRVGKSRLTTKRTRSLPPSILRRNAANGFVEGYATDSMERIAMRPETTLSLSASRSALRFTLRGRLTR